ncbi:unnamed protein product [Trifolium pratense]|uniref:Uncharacterized protein n=1 Tax=Trifolium pratense TaxID=57577 RepID=A0ACB0JMK4_TRIPR|nr:unnamed protein product [Trifolium pratense]
MKTKTFIFLLFLCAEILIFIVAIKQSNDEKQLGATKESKTKFAIDHWKRTSWRSTFPKKDVKGGKKIEQNPVESGSGGNGDEGSEQGEAIQNGGEKEI